MTEPHAPRVQFQDLPPEVRVMIWKFAADRQRGIYKVPGPIPPRQPAVAQACRESRAVFCESWVSKESRASTDQLVSRPWGSPRWKFFDTVWDSVLVSFESLRDEPFPLYGLNDVCSVIITNHDSWEEHWMFPILALYSIEMVSLVAGEVVLPRECWDVVAEYMCCLGPSLVVDLDDGNDIEKILDMLESLLGSENSWIIERNIAPLREMQWEFSSEFSDDEDIVHYSWDYVKSSFNTISRAQYRKDVELRRAVLFKHT